MSKKIANIPSALMAKTRRIALPYGGKALLHENTGISEPTLRALLATGQARPDVIERLEAGVKKIAEAKASA